MKRYFDKRTGKYKAYFQMFDIYSKDALKLKIKAQISPFFYQETEKIDRKNKQFPKS